MDFRQILENIVEFDQRVRFAAIFDRFGTLKEKIQRDGTSLMMDEYDTKNMLREEVSSWFHRKNLSNKIGKGHYSMTVYDKLVRITMPLGTDNFIIFSLSEINEHPPIIRHVQEMLG